MDLGGLLDLLDDHAGAADLAVLGHQLHAALPLELLDDGLHCLVHVHVLHSLVVLRLLEDGGQLAPAFRHDIYIRHFNCN